MLYTRQGDFAMAMALGIVLIAVAFAANLLLLEDLVNECRARRVTIVLATHQVFQARRLADRMALLLDGAIVEVAPAAAFLDTPRDPRTRAFLNGEMIC